MIKVKFRFTEYYNAQLQRFLFLAACTVSCLSSNMSKIKLVTSSCIHCFTTC